MAFVMPLAWGRCSGSDHHLMSSEGPADPDAIPMCPVCTKLFRTMRAGERAPTHMAVRLESRSGKRFDADPGRMVY